MSYTQKQFQFLENLYQFYNHTLFGGILPEIMLNFFRGKNFSGFFSASKWKDDNNTIIHEITINPQCISDVYDVEFHQTLVHEMVHLWQLEFGKTSRNGYHNSEFANKMIEIGLMPSHTGKIGGRTTGQKMGDYFLEDGAFVLAFKKLQENQFELKKLLPKSTQNETTENKFLKPIPEEKPKKNKTKYTCKCKKNLWGKAGLVFHCKDCETQFKEV